jgi:hypothetical protein
VQGAGQVLGGLTACSQYPCLPRQTGKIVAADRQSLAASGPSRREIITSATLGTRLAELSRRNSREV